MVSSATFLKYSPLFSMNFCKATFGDSSLSSFSVLLLESRKTNILFGTKAVNFSERYSFLLLISSFNSVNVYLLQSLLKCHLMILFELILPLVLYHYFYFAHPPYSLLHLQTNIFISNILIFLRRVIKSTHLILHACSSYFHQSEMVKCLIAIMFTLCY